MPSRLPLTLSDLIATIQDVVGPENDGLVVTTVRHLLRSGRLTGLRSGTRWDSLQPRTRGEEAMAERR